MSRQSQFDSQFLVSETESDERSVLHLPEVESSHPQTQILLDNLVSLSVTQGRHQERDSWKAMTASNYLYILGTTQAAC